MHLTNMNHHLSRTRLALLWPTLDRSLSQGVHKWVNYKAVVVVSGSCLVATRCTRYVPAVYWIHEYNIFYCMYDTISLIRDSQIKCNTKDGLWQVFTKLCSSLKDHLVCERICTSPKRRMVSTLLRSLDLSTDLKDAQKEWRALLLPSSVGFAADCIHPYLISNPFVPLWYGTIPLHGIVWQVDIQGTQGSW